MPDSPTGRVRPPSAANPQRLPPAGMLQMLAERLAQAGQSRTALLVARLDSGRRSLVVQADGRHRRLLEEVERRVRSMLRPGDRYAFASMDEVWLLLPDLSGEALAGLAAHALLERLRRPFDEAAGATDASMLQLRPAIGGAWFAGPCALSAHGLLDIAQQASAHALDADDSVAIRQVQAPTAAEGRPAGDHEARIRRALEGNELEVRFQPKVDLRTGRCLAAEALIRWPEHRGEAPIDPATLVEICEQRGMIRRLTQFTLNATLRHMADWRDAGMQATVGVNLSAAMLADAALPMAVSQALETWGIAPGSLTLELTESALIRDAGTAGTVMRELQALGCKLSIDDFGTGYSPFTYLRHFPLHELKIDRSFVEPLLRESADRAIVASLVQLAHAFGMQIVAEGVEDGRTEAYLRELGCDLGQGWHYAPALAPDAFAAWCAARNAGAFGLPPVAAPLHGLPL